MTSDQPGQPGQPGPGARTWDADEDLPGDPACLLRRVCPACGSVAGEDPPTVCPNCHAQMPGD
jgi:rubrerythrin